MLTASECATRMHTSTSGNPPAVNSVHSDTFLLSIIIPTFNRQYELTMLLDQLCTEIVGLENEIEILVSENCSTDGTAIMLADFAATRAERISFRWFSQPSNLGAIGNIHFLVNQSRARYIWALGDDDALIQGKLREISAGLRSMPINLLLVRTEGIYEWDCISRKSEDRAEVRFMNIKLNDKDSADYLFAGGFLGSVIISAKTWMKVVPLVEALQETCYSNWAAVLKVATDDGEYYVMDAPCVKGNFNMQGESKIPAFRILVIGRVRVWAAFEGTQLQQVLKTKIQELVSIGWAQIALGKANDVITLRDKLQALGVTTSLLGILSFKTYFFALVSFLFPFPKILETVRNAIRVH